MRVQASRRAEVKLQGFFQPVDGQVKAVRMWGETGLLELSKPEEFTHGAPPEDDRTIIIIKRT
jgi:hypothetical protein